MQTVYNHVIRSGNVVNVTAWATKKAAGAFGGFLMTGLPKPIATQRVRFPSPTSYVTTKPFTYGEIDAEQGRLNFNTEGTQMAANDLVIIQMTYICQDS